LCSFAGNNEECWIKAKREQMDKKEKFWGRNEQNQNFRDLTAPAAV